MSEQRVTWRGVTLCQRAAAMMTEVATLVGPVQLIPTQGSFSGSVSASAGTHAGCGAIDLAGEGLSDSARQTIVREMRRVGWAAWLRTPAQSDWPYHVHGIAVACPGLSPAAADQVSDYLAGRNGLASGGPDDGPRDFVGTTWETYQAGKPKPPSTPGDDMAVPRVFTSKGSNDSSSKDDWLTLLTVEGKFVDLSTSKDVDTANRYVQFVTNPKDGALYQSQVRDIQALLAKAK